ncbi:hypothetical protein [Brevundimonas sp.]|uniref:hypothetical protein n=1 Tax=Brevundimonas sp. TaxID=1871086 RepID=UPI002D2F4CEA|nr:hypothetical protein [Brevundimonas sp.]HYC73829.1 hypothetical protein [Brevundimonas sp.]
MMLSTYVRTFAATTARLGAALGAALIFLAGPALAQIPQPDAYQPVDRNGVNLLSGKIKGPGHTISIGQPGQGGLSLTVNYDTAANTFIHDMAGLANKEPIIGDGSDYPWVYVTVPQGATTYYQRDVDYNYDLVNGSGELVGGNTTNLVYTALDGTRTEFSLNLRSGAPYVARLGMVSSVTKPNGEVWTFHYEAETGDPYKRLKSVTNNLGYQIHFEYLTNEKTLAGWGELAKVTAFNNTVDWCAPTAATCTYSQTWPSLTFTKSSTERTITDSFGNTTRYFFSGGWLTGYSRPAAGTGQVISVTWGTTPDLDLGKVVTVNDGAGTWTYWYSPPPPPPIPAYFETATYVTDPLGQQSRLIISSSFDGPPAGRRITNPRSFRDPLMNVTEYQYETGRLTQVTYPEGNKEQVGYTDRGDVTGVFRIGKPGSGLTGTSITAAYANCSSPMICGRPTSITDARGNVTDYTYSPVHGGVLTETAPAPTPGAVRPQTRYTWEQRYAWYRQDGSGAITQAPSPVWVMVGQSQCMTGATC